MIHGDEAIIAISGRLRHSNNMMGDRVKSSRVSDEGRAVFASIMDASTTKFGPA